MSESPERTSQPARISSTTRWMARSAYGAMIATLVALAVFVAIGTISWAAVRGYQGVGICVALGAVAGATLRGPGSRLARVLGGGIGGVLAGFAALSMGEMIAPGTAQWALAGAAYGALFGLPLAALVGGLIGLLGRRGLVLEDRQDHRWRLTGGATDGGARMMLIFPGAPSRSPGSFSARARDSRDDPRWVRHPVACASGAAGGVELAWRIDMGLAADFQGGSRRRPSGKVLVKGGRPARCYHRDSDQGAPPTGSGAGPS
jgi:hypothetical protein